MPVTVQAPGKLMLAGEYAILTPGSLALMLALKRYVRASLQSSPDTLLISDLHPSPWPVPELAQLDWRQAPEPLRFAVAALELALAYLGEQAESKPLPPFVLNLSSQLQSAEQKLGLGSSAAVCVAVVAGVLAWAGRDLSAHQMAIFKLALLAHRKVQGNGSGADIAASVYGSICAYTSPDLAYLPYGSLHRVVEQKWPLLGLEKLPWPPGLALQFGWTGEAAASGHWVRWFEAWQAEEPEQAAHFLFEANINALALKQSLQEAQVNGVVQSLARARRLLQILNAVLPEPPETPKLSQLADAAEALGGCGKFSGAGGGDCGLAWVPSTQISSLHQAWQSQGITPLALVPDLQGVQLIE